MITTDLPMIAAVSLMSFHTLTSLGFSSLHQNWVHKRDRLRQNRIGCESSHDQFNDVLQYVNGRWYRSEHYATWLNRLSEKTPKDHPDKQPLLAAAAYLQDSIIRAKSIFRTDDARRGNDSVQGVVDQGDQGESLFNQLSKEQGWIDNGRNDTGLTELFGEFRFD